MEIPPTKENCFVDGNKLNKVYELKYLRNIISNDDSLDEEIMYRIRNTMKAYKRFSARVFYSKKFNSY